MMRIGMGYDIHRLASGRPLVLGGERIPFEKGLLGHSDADVLVHAACDALLGAAGMGDIGDHFPDTDPRYRDAYSIDLLREVYQWVYASRWTLVNLDATIFAQAPRMAPHKPMMAARMADCMGVERQLINIKATTTEGLGAIGCVEGIAAMCVVMIQSSNQGTGQRSDSQGSR